VHRPGFVGCLSWTWEPFRRTSYHPSPRSRRSTSRLSTASIIHINTHRQRLPPREAPRGAHVSRGATRPARAGPAERLDCGKSPPRYHQNSRPSPFQGAGVCHFGPSHPGAGEARAAPSRRSRVRRGFRRLRRRALSCIIWCRIARATASTSSSKRIVVSGGHLTFV